MSAAITRQEQLLAAAARRLDRLRKSESFDPARPDSVPTSKQQQVFDDFGKFKQQWIRAGNQSGKSASCARIVSWVITDTHPTWKRPAEWGDESLLIIVAGRTGKQIEDSLLPKIRGYLEPGTYKEVRIGNIIQRLELDNGNRVIFQSLENPNTARERLMSYVAHLTWCDELPPTMDLVRELLVRTQARNGYALWSFTPTVVSAEIQKFVDSLVEPEGRVYRFHMLDNPLYSDPTRKQELLSRYSHLPKEMQDAIFEGEWLSGDDQVYYFHYESMVRMPPNYSVLWRHVLSVDPGTRNTGVTLWAEEPNSAVWYCVLAKYLQIPVPTELVNKINELTSHVNVVRRISDPHEVWFISTAAAAPYNQNYFTPKKDGRKTELIKQVQESLGKDMIISPNCPDLTDEIQECRWSNKAEGKIVNSSKYHLLDTAQYFRDLRPKPEVTPPKYDNWQHWLYAQNEKLNLAEEKEKTRTHKMQVRKRNRWKRR